MLGVLFLPLIVLGCFELVTAILLLSPLPAARPILGLAKQTRTPIAWTAIGTVSVILLVFAVSSAVEIGEARTHGVRDKGGELDALHRRCVACCVCCVGHCAGADSHNMHAGTPRCRPGCRWC